MKLGLASVTVLVRFVGDEDSELDTVDVDRHQWIGFSENDNEMPNE